VEEKDAERKFGIDRNAEKSVERNGSKNLLKSKPKPDHRNSLRVGFSEPWDYGFLLLPHESDLIPVRRS
jgi:hypothetical protein